MERITPIDLESARFPLVRKGYDTEAVDAMLKAAAAELESLTREVQSLRSQHELELKELNLFRSKESTLADALILAQKTSDETRAAAHKEGELIIAHAKRQAEDLRREANEELADLDRKIEKRIQDRKTFEARFRSLLEEYSRSLQESVTLMVEVENDAATG
jgi:cell division initiation protein